MPVKIQRTLNGTYHLMVDDGEFVISRDDLKLIADQAVTDGVVEQNQARTQVLESFLKEAQAEVDRLSNLYHEDAQLWDVIHDRLHARLYRLEKLIADTRQLFPPEDQVSKMIREGKDHLARFPRRKNF